MIEVKIHKIDKSAKLPHRMSTHAAGYDLYSCHQQNIILKKGEVKLIPTGIAISLPPRSGLAIKHGIGVLNAPGTIDADYRGEIKIILFNFSKDDFIITPGKRVAQMVIAKHEIVDFAVTEKLDKTTRGSVGFGHTSH